MTPLREGWLNRQLDRVTDDVEKWPDWMKREAAFAPSGPTVRETQHVNEPDGSKTMKAGGEGVR
jgi:hypothetical protein